MGFYEKGNPILSSGNSGKLNSQTSYNLQKVMQRTFMSEEQSQPEKHTDWYLIK